MHLQLWSYNYDPEPTGIAPLSGALARALKARGHSISVVAAHPHYPEPRWGRSFRPYKEDRDGINVVRLPLWFGRGSTFARIRQEVSYGAMLQFAAPFLGRPDAIIATSPSFPALGPVMVSAAVRRIPWILWLQDILPDGAAATGLMEEGTALRLARRFERLAYERAARVVVISDSFVDNLRAKNVATERLARIYNPATRDFPDRAPDRPDGPPILMTMGNIGFSQNLVEITRAFEDSSELEGLDVRLLMVGDGMDAPNVRAASKTDRVVITGVVGSNELDGHLASASLALVSQRYEGYDFNVPSKLMNFMAFGLPVVAAVRAESEVARIIERSGGGWVVDSAAPGSFADVVRQALGDESDRKARAEAALAFARANFGIDAIGAQFERVVEDAIAETLGSAPVVAFEGGLRIPAGPAREVTGRRRGRGGGRRASDVPEPQSGDATK